MFFYIIFHQETLTDSFFQTFIIQKCSFKTNIIVKEEFYNINSIVKSFL